MGNLRFKMDWVSLYLGGKQKKLCDRVTFALFYFVFEGNFQIEASGSLYLEGYDGGGGGGACVTSLLSL